ncbi:MAG: acyl-CoA dehydrogenase family protein [Halieaceae bacterium]|nr:acyl-CoA dehydrogenase family protein [Halieaceae bacterium]
MDFNDTPEEAAFRQKARNWLAENAIPESELEGDNLIHRHRPWLKRLYEGGWSCISWPKRYGGQGASPIQEVIWNQEQSHYPHLKTHRFSVGQKMVAPTLMEFLEDRPETLERLLPPIASGDETWVQLFSEPAGGSDLAALRTRAERDGDAWLVNGQKIWSSHAVEAKWGFIVTRTDPTVPKHKGLTCLYLDMENPGIEIRPIKQANGESEFNEVFFADVRIPDNQRVGQVGQGWEVAVTMLSHERLAMGGENFGVDYEALRKLAGEVCIDGRPAIENAQVRAKLADFYCVEAGLRATTNRAISALSKGKNPGSETSINNMVIGASTQEIAAFALDLMEQAGIVLDESTQESSFFQQAFLSIPSMRIAGGTDEIQANIVAESVLGLPREPRVDKNVPFNELPGGK